MKNLYRIILVFAGFSFYLGQTITTANAACNWNSRNAYTYFWDTCSGKYSLNGYIVYKSGSSCYKYQWTVNGNKAGNGNVMNYPITANGSYSICVKVTDTCNSCDTTYCTSRTITCIKSSCNWKSRYPYFSASDSCYGKVYKYSVNGYISFNYSKTGCFKYQWTVNGSKAGTSRYLNYPVYKNGTYVVCMYVLDTCNNCDTSFCSTRTISCISSSCNWNSLKANLGYWDTCNTSANKYSLNAYIAFSSRSCLKYQWTVNGSNAGTSYVMNYPITKNGSYSVCVKVKDTCNNCDTSYCTTRTVTCVKGSACNWKNNIQYYYQYISDSCPTKYFYGYLGLKNPKGILITWRDGSQVFAYGSGYKYTPKTNGYHNVCVVLYDTTNNCDTTLCKSLYYNCINTCNWKARKAATAYWDSCSTSKGGRYSLNGYISFNPKSCYKYQWKVNGNNAGSNYYFNYPITQNGSYTVCVTVKDTCNNCDTTYCTTRTINCIPGSKCNFNARTPYTYFWDSCTGKKYQYSLNAYINFKSFYCLTYKWTVNGTYAGSGSILNYPITKNGTYSICVKVIDSCNNCDTTICGSRTISCVKGSTCNWNSRKPYFMAGDTCDNKNKIYSLNGYIYFNYSNMGCFKYQWLVNGNVVSTSRPLNYKITQNGTYVLCMKVTDTCSNCDTSFCSTRVITCINSSKCNWNSRKANYYFWDTCNATAKKYSLNGYISFNPKSCYKYQWKVNGAYAGTSYILHYPISANGTYQVCVKVTDTCNNCDTMYCTTRTITCVSGGKCNWNSQGPYISYWDTCGGKKNKYSLNAYAYFTKGRTCHVYQWTVNGNKAGNNYFMSYPISGNGTYSVCLKVTDTCNNCDTTFCTYRVFNCSSTRCNWKSKSAYFITKDTCIVSIKNYSVNGVIALAGSSKCYTYKWTVNGNYAGTNQYMNYSITANGTYSVCVNVKDTCNKCDTTYCEYVKVYCVPSGIGKVQHSAILKVYPNPTGGIVKLEWEEGNSDYRILNANGQLLQSGTIENGTNVLDLNKYPGGLYFLEVRNGNSVISEKISVLK